MHEAALNDKAAHEMNLTASSLPRRQIMDRSRGGRRAQSRRRSPRRSRPRPRIDAARCRSVSAMMALAAKMAAGRKPATLATTVASDDRLERRSFIGHAGASLDSKQKEKPPHRRVRGLGHEKSLRAV